VNFRGQNYSCLTPDDRLCAILHVTKTVTFPAKSAWGLTGRGLAEKFFALIPADPAKERCASPHSKGVAKLRFEDLPDDLQKQYHYDAGKVAAYRKQVEDAKKTAPAKAAAAEQEQAKAKEQARRTAEEKRRVEQERVDAEKRHQEMLATTRTIGIGIGLFLAAFVYLVPSIVGRRKRNAVAIFVLNLLLGWTFLGWVLALVWACT
jgi:hypothetical protein